MLFLSPGKFSPLITFLNTQKNTQKLWDTLKPQAPLELLKFLFLIWLQVKYTNRIGSQWIVQSVFFLTAAVPVGPPTTSESSMNKHFVEIRLPDEKWDETLTNAKSQKGQEYSEKISQAVEQTVTVANRVRLKLCI